MAHRLVIGGSTERRSGRGWNAGLLTGRQKVRLDPLFAASEHVEVEATWCIYQRMVAACREPDKKLGKRLCRR